MKKEAHGDCHAAAAKPAQGDCHQCCDQNQRSKKKESCLEMERKYFWDQRNNPVVNKSKAFAIQIIEIYKSLVSEKKEYILSRQVLRSGTSIGANVREAQRGQSSPDFYAKMNIALKEADETAYWLELLYEGKYLEEERFNKIYEDCEELIRLLVYILKRNYSK